MIIFFLPLVLSIQVMLLIDIELSYINTNHEDFIGFAKYVPLPPTRVTHSQVLQAVPDLKPVPGTAVIPSNHPVPVVVQ